MKTQAWGWLAAGVMAAGLNATYHQGGLAWVHCVTGKISHSSSAVLALATGNAQRFVAEAQLIAHQQQAGSALPAMLVRVESQVENRVENQVETKLADANLAEARATEPKITRAQADFARLATVAARHEEQLARVEANRALMEARVESQVEDRIARAHIPAASFDFSMAPTARLSRCSQIRIDVPHIDLPRVRSMRVPMGPVVQVELPGAGPL